MTTNTNEKAAGATNSNGLHTITNNSNFAIYERCSKAFAHRLIHRLIHRLGVIQ